MNNIGGNQFYENLRSIFGNKAKELTNAQLYELYQKADEKDGQDGNVALDFLFEVANSSDYGLDIDITEEEYADAYNAIAGDDGKLSFNEVSGGTTVYFDNTKANSQVDFATTPVEKVTLDPQTTSSEKLREGRHAVSDQITAMRAQKESAIAQATQVSEETKKAYDDSIKKLEEIEDIKTENDETIKDLNDKKSDYENNKIPAQENTISTLEGNINDKKVQISGFERDIASLTMPDKKQFTKTEYNEDGSVKGTKFDSGAWQAACQKQYYEPKEKLEKEISQARKELSGFENDLLDADKVLTDLKQEKVDIENEILKLVEQALNRPEYKEAAEAVQTALQAMIAAEQNQVDTARKYEGNIANLEANIAAYDQAIPIAEAREAEEAKRAEAEKEAQEQQAAQNNSAAGAASGGGSVGGGGGVSGGSGVSGGNSVGGSGSTGTTQNNDATQELNKAKEEAQTQLNNAKQDLANIRAGNDSEGKLKEAKGKINTAYNDYISALNGAGASETEIAQANNLKNAIDSSYDAIDKNDEQIDAQKEKIAELETALKAAKNKKTTLEAQMAELNKASSSDSVNNKKAELQNLISSTDTEISNLENQLESVKSQLSKLESNANTLKSQLINNKKAFDDFNANQAATVKEKYNGYKDMQNAYDDLKSDLVYSAQSKVTEALSALSNANLAVANDDATKLAKNYSADDYNSEAGSKICNYVKSHLRGTRGRCLAGVSDAVEAIYGKRLGVYAYQAADKLAGKEAGYEDVASHFKEVNIERSELKNLPPGCIVVWDRNNSSSGAAVAGHIAITAGDGVAYSDHLESPMHYLNSSVGYRVFVPIS